MLELRSVSHRYGDVLAVDQLSLTVASGEFFTLLGPSGCGKTTLLRLIAGFERPSAGQILLDGEDLSAMPPERRPVHTVFQSYALFPHLTVAENIAFPLRMARRPEAEIRERVREQLALVRLEGMAERYPAALSGGQRQRVAVARAIVNRPRILLLDEPLAALDLKLREQLQLELIRLQRSLGITFVYVTHDQSEALALSHRVGVMNRGRLVQVDAPAAIYERPRNRFVADFIGQCNLLEARVQGQADGRLRVELPGLPVLLDVPAEPGVEAGEQGLLAVRPEHIRLAPAGPGEQELAGQIQGHLFLGAVSLYQVELANGMRLDVQAASRPGEPAPEPGAPMQLSWPLQAGRFLRD